MTVIHAVHKRWRFRLCLSWFCLRYGVYCNNGWNRRMQTYDMLSVRGWTGQKCYLCFPVSVVLFTLVPYHYDLLVICGAFLREESDRILLCIFMRSYLSVRFNLIVCLIF